MSRPIGQRRRHLARWILATLVLVHLAALSVYHLRERQSQLLGMYVDARDQWRDGHLDVAAREYATFLAERPSATWPFALYKNFPDEASAWFVLGRVETDRGRVDAALAAFEQAMRLDANRGRREYRDLLLRSGRGAALIAFANAEARADPASPVAAKNLGAGLLATDQPAAAVAAYEHALQLLPAWRARVDRAAPAGLSSEEADILNLLSVAARLAGDAARADAACARAGSRQAGALRLDRLCAAYRENAAGDRAAAVHTLAAYAPPAPEHEALAAAIAPPL